MNEASLSVLVVEDDPSTAEVVQMALDSASHYVRRVVDGRAALAALDEEWPDLLLLDRRLPDVDGLELCAQVRQLKPGSPYLPILMLTALQAPDQKATAFERGADDYVTKPFDVEELLARVRVWGRAARRVRELHELRQLYQQSQQDALTDPLTGLFNRRALENLLDQETEKARRLGYALGLLVIDVDHFKNVNDWQGHLAGDRTLEAVAHALRGALRRTDQLARFGGDEFVALLPGCDPEALPAVGEQLREAVAGLRQSGAVPAVVTVSIGGAVVRGEEADATRLLGAADDAVYRAKAEGRNRVVVADGGAATAPPADAPPPIRAARGAAPQDRRRADPLLRDLVEHAEPVLVDAGFHLDARGNSDRRDRSWVEFHRPDDFAAPQVASDGEGATVVQMGHRRHKHQLVVNAYHVDADLEHKPHAKLLGSDDPEKLPDVVGYVADMVKQLPTDDGASGDAPSPPPSPRGRGEDGEGDVAADGADHS
jgi:two-component system, cell cycle response regulator